LAIILDNVVYSAPVIQDRISGGRAQISGSFTPEEATFLAMILRAGALPAPVKIIQNVTVGASLGQDSIDKGFLAAKWGTLLVVLFMAFYYRLAGVIADVALALNVILLIGALAALNATLTLPGIAGIILTIGMSVDSNVLIFERIREELRTGKTVRMAIDSGYDKAFLTIIDSHVTTLITAFVLFIFGTGPIKGFAVTLSLGVLINLFTSLVGTKVVFDVINSRKKLERLSI
ncbi:MAG TPA: protein translocase subunit SecD, partial [Nitrospiria bacterium]|nr:protein translocase subunit SecD [Nitrospiria bacterium]